MSPSKSQKDRLRIRYTLEQLQRLERQYESNPYPNATLIYGLSQDMGITEKQLRQWFLHRRKRGKKNDGSSKFISALSFIDVEKDKENVLWNTNDQIEEVSVNPVQEEDLAYDPVKGHNVMEQMFSQYKGLCPTHLLQAHFNNQYQHKDNENTFTQDEYIMSWDAASNEE